MTRKFGKETYFCAKIFATDQSRAFSQEEYEVEYKKVYEKIEALKNTMPGHKFRIVKYPGDIFGLFAKKKEP